MNKIVITYGEVGRAQEATARHDKVESVSKNTLGDGHTVSATALHDLTTSYYRLGNHGDAVILEIQVLD